MLYSFSGPIVTAGAGNGLSVGDVNNDGLADLLVFAGKSSVAVSLSKGDGTFRQGSTPHRTDGRPGAHLRADVNGDGRADVSARGFRAAKGFTSTRGR